MRQTPMAEAGNKLGDRRYGGPVKLAEVVGRVLGPVTARRGFATTDLIASWPEIVGQSYAECTRPEKIVWPRGEAAEGKAALLVLRVDGPRAIFVQHEAGQIIERVNAFLGYAAVAQIRIVQAPVTSTAAAKAVPPAPLAAEAEAHLDKALAGVAEGGLREALDRLGRGVLSDRRR